MLQRETQLVHQTSVLFQFGSVSIDMVRLAKLARPRNMKNRAKMCANQKRRHLQQHEIPLCINFILRRRIVLQRKQDSVDHSKQRAVN